MTRWGAKGFDGVIGLQYDELTPDRVRAHWTVGPAMHQPFGITHGGVYCSVIESLASLAAGLWLGPKGRVVGVNNNTDFLRAVSEGTLHAEALPIHRGRSQQLWQVSITDEQQRLVARGQVRIQNLTSPPADA
ncbi:PaaI family thioesterase [Skermania sp. ID1734]|uniref:PaaI family thioesterase n=1 Tax=Skermania sp. ID1734 TaxID=2597516 RepID=UPI0021068313|nr:PaaI family thioesterase [Skermania sp. ID1734]